ncbi:MAG: hypothetical protein ACREBG_15765 [Pyrinomonadaceae bacterium]
MDPNETLRQIHAFLARGDEGDEVDFLCQDLFDWLARGGFAPDWTRFELGTGYYRCREVYHRRGERVFEESED